MFRGRLPPLHYRFAAHSGTTPYTERTHLLNFVHFIKHLGYTGAVAPSSRYLALEMVQSVRRHRSHYPGKPLRILELGPGTGPITESIVQYLLPGDTLDIVEIDQRFYELIRRRFAGKQVRVFNMDVLEFDVQEPYDIIISSIPYEQIPESVTGKIWRKKLSMITAGGSISYYKYYRFNHFSCDFERMINRRYCTRDKLVWKNVPPAIVYHLSIPAGVASRPVRSSLLHLSTV